MVCNLNPVLVQLWRRAHPRPLLARVRVLGRRATFLKLQVLSLYLLGVQAHVRSWEAQQMDIGH